MKNADSSENSTTYKFNEFRLDAKNLSLFRQNEIVSLSPKAVEVLLYLVKSSGHIVSKQEILDEVWANTFVEEANLTHHVSALRKALGEEKTGRKFIETIPRRGYRFVAPVSEASPSAVEITVSERTGTHVVIEEEIEFPDKNEASIRQNPRLDEAKNSLLPAAKPRFVSGWRLIAAAAGLAALLLLGVLAAGYFRQPRLAFFDDSTRADWRLAPVMEAKSAGAGRLGGVSFAPDGKFVAFHRGEGEKSAIFVKQIDGGEPVKLTDGNWLETNPVWSADGQRVAFLSNRDNYVKGVWTIPFLGGTPALLKQLDLSSSQSVRLMRWSSDGGRIFYTVDERLYVYDLSGEPKLLSDFGERYQNPRGYAVAPDETQFAFAAKVADEPQVFVRSMTGGEPRQVTRGGGTKRQPAWFADGRHLAFSSDVTGNFQIYLLDLTTGKTTQMTLDGADNAEPLVSADGRAILFHASREEANIYSYSLDRETETAHTTSNGLQLFPDASAGNRIAFQSSSSIAKLFDGSLKIVSLDGANQIFDVASAGYNPKFAPDGASVAFVRSLEQTENIWKVSANGQNETQLTRGGINISGFNMMPLNFDSTNFAWSPDGSQIAFSSSKNGFSNLWTVTSDGAREIAWTNNAEPNTAFENFFWSPDARNLAFVLYFKPTEAGAKRKSRICMTDGAETKTLYEANSLVRVLGWSPETREFFAAAVEFNYQTKESTVVVLKIAASSNAQPNVLARLPAADFNNLRLAPGAGEIVFAANPDAKSENLYLISTTGGEARRLTDNRELTVRYSGASWSPDGRTIFYSKQTSGDSYNLLTIKP